MHDIVHEEGDLKVSRNNARDISINASLHRVSPREHLNMRATNLLILLCTVCVVRATSPVSTRVARTLPAEFSPARWHGLLKNWWTSGRFLQLPRDTAVNFLRLIVKPDTTKPITFNFRPEDGQRASYSYQQRFGYRGQWLIELLGVGYHPDSLTPRHPLPALSLTPPRPSPF